MKIAVVGKGGSGKSTVSWLLAHSFSKQGKKVIAIDADFNMDLLYHFGTSIDEILPVYNNHQSFRKAFEMKEKEKWFDMLTRDESPKLDFERLHTLLQPKQIHEKLWMTATGIGDEKTLYSGKCGHSHSAPLKYALACTEVLSNEMVIVDSVAGVDMLGYGLFMGCDLISIVVEDLPNSIKVANQIIQMCKKLDLAYYIVGNKVMNNQNLKLQFGTNLVGCIYADPFLISPKWENISSKVTDDLVAIIDSLEKKIDKAGESKWVKLQKFDLQKSSIQQYLNNSY